MATVEQYQLAKAAWQLDILAEQIDLWFSADANPGVQDDCRRWAQEHREFAGEEATATFDRLIQQGLGEVPA